MSIPQIDVEGELAISVRRILKVFPNHRSTLSLSKSKIAQKIDTSFFQLNLGGATMCARTFGLKSTDGKATFTLLSLTMTSLILLISASLSYAQQLGCRQFVFIGASFRSYAAYPGDTNVSSWSFDITDVNGSVWAGIFDSGEEVHGTMSGDNFTLRRPKGQAWSGACSANGISGNFRKDGLSAIGYFMLSPQWF